MKKNKGITLISLVVTIIILLILASISLYILFNNNGIFNKANQASNKYDKERSKEELTLALSDAQIVKHSEGLTNEQLDEKLNEVGKINNEDNTKITVNGYIWKIDRNELIIIDCLGKDYGIEISYKIIGNENWVKSNPNIQVEVTVRSNKGTLDTSSITIKKNGEDITNTVNVESGSFTLTTEESTTFIVSAKDINEKQLVTKQIKVIAKIDNTAPTLESVYATASMKDILISANATDTQSGVKEYNYLITPTTGLSKSNGIFTQGETVKITSSETATYTISITAKDNCENISEPQTREVTTVDSLTVSEAKSKINKDNIKDYIGTKVKYIPQEGGEWRVFYYDSEGYFGPVNTLYLKRSYEDSKIVRLLSYSGYSASEEGIKMMKRMNPQWRDYPTENANVINLNNERMASWLCDPKNWTKYKTEDSSFAIGSPSLEMFIKAYNLYKQGNPNGTALVCKVTNEYGYLVGANTSDLSNLKGSTPNQSVDFGPENVFGSDYWWLASPAGIPGYSTVTVMNYYQLYNSDGNTYKYCPIVPLDK